MDSHGHLQRVNGLLIVSHCLVFLRLKSRKGQWI